MRVAIFVDAGYLFARCSTVLTGTDVPRVSTELDHIAVLYKLIEHAGEKATNTSLLRVYWYDGARGSGLSAGQQAIADAENVKLRLGVLTPYGRQKGVDSLIVTDLVELARNRAISDAVLLSGDEDVRIGVTIAQSYGVRVHLVGIGSGRESQSRTLMQEVDTRTEWGRDSIGEFFSISSAYSVSDQSQKPNVLSVAEDETASVLNEVASELVASLTADQVRAVAELGANDPVPREHDHELLINSRSRLGRRLVEAEKHLIRMRFKQAAMESANAP